MGLKKLIKVGENSRIWFGLFLLLMATIYILASLGRLEWIVWVAIVSGFILAIFVLGQAGVREYFRRKGYREIGFGDFVVWTSIIFGVTVIINSILLIQIVRNSAPMWLVKFSTTTGVTAGIVIVLLAIIHLVTPKPN